MSPGTVVQVTFTQSLVRLMPVMSGRETTLMSKRRESERAGEPLSVTVMEKLWVVLASASDVNHVNSPDVGWTDAPGGPPGARLNVRVFAGKSESLAAFEITTQLPAWTVRLAITESNGAEFVAIREFVGAGCVWLRFVTDISVSARLLDETGSGVMLEAIT